MATITARLQGKYRRSLAKAFGRRTARLPAQSPMVTFTFDDAPRTAFDTGGELLADVGATGTYFLSLGLLGQETEVGRIADRADLERALARGDDLGCHTYDHSDAWYVSASDFERSIAQNAKAFAALFPGCRFTSFAYPKSGATLRAKLRVRKHFPCARGGGQTANIAVVDLNLVNGFFLDRRTRVTLDEVKAAIDFNAANGGWLVFATHDVCRSPSPFGCEPEFLQAAIRHSLASGARIASFSDACRHIQSSGDSAAGSGEK